MSNFQSSEMSFHNPSSLFEIPDEQAGEYAVTRPRGRVESATESVDYIPRDQITILGLVALEHSLTPLRLDQANSTFGPMH